VRRPSNPDRKPDEYKITTTKAAFSSCRQNDWASTVQPTVIGTYWSVRSWRLRDCTGRITAERRRFSRGLSRRVQVDRRKILREALFEPLGVTRTEWERGRDGDALAASGLRITLRDLARIGLMVLDGGRWHGRQVVPAEWLAASFAAAVSMPDGRRYGYQWYLGAAPRDNGAGGVQWEETVSAMGNGGQRLFLLPRLGLVVAITAGNYDAPDQWRPPSAVLRDGLLPALREE
jgi:hypothetical protein